MHDVVNVDCVRGGVKMPRSSGLGREGLLRAVDLDGPYQGIAQGSRGVHTGGQVHSRDMRRLEEHLCVRLAAHITAHHLGDTTQLVRASIRASRKCS